MLTVGVVANAGSDGNDVTLTDPVVLIGLIAVPTGLPEVSRMTVAPAEAVWFPLI